MNAVWNTAFGFRMTALSRLLNKAICAILFLGVPTSDGPHYRLIQTETTFLPLQAFHNWTLPRWWIKYNRMKTNIVLNVNKGNFAWTESGTTTRDLAYVTTLQMCVIDYLLTAETHLVWMTFRFRVRKYLLLNQGAIDSPWYSLWWF
jgi:hypothetical protein